MQKQPLSDEEIYRLAKKRMEEKKGFYSHLTAYIIVNLFLALIWLFTIGPRGFPWFFFPLVGWGIGVIFHALNTFLFTREGSSDWERRQIEKEADKIRRGR